MNTHNISIMGAVHEESQSRGFQTFGSSSKSTTRNGTKFHMGTPGL